MQKIHVEFSEHVKALNIDWVNYVVLTQSNKLFIDEFLTIFSELELKNGRCLMLLCSLLLSFLKEEISMQNFRSTQSWHKDFVQILYNSMS